MGTPPLTPPQLCFIAIDYEYYHNKHDSLHRKHPLNEMNVSRAKKCVRLMPSNM